MSIRLKFNLAMLLVFALGFTAAAFLIEKILLENAKAEVALKARIMMAAARSIRAAMPTKVQPGWSSISSNASRECAGTGRLKPMDAVLSRPIR